MQPNLTLPKKERLLYIDALRGLAMLMVVFVHVEIYSFFNFTHTTPLMHIFSAVHMPLFFFISGVCIYKPDKKYGLAKVKNDFLRLIIPAFLVGLLYTYFKSGEDMMFFFANSMKAGYWFTISLFEVLLIYYLINNLTKNNNKAFMIVLWTIAGLLYLLKLPFKMVGSLETLGNYMCLHQTFNFFVFFALGITASKYRSKTHRLLEDQVFSAAVLLLFSIGSLVVFGLVPKYAGSSIVWKVLDTFGETLVGLFGICLLYVIFYKIQSVFNSSNRIAKSLVFVGNNTLAIYLIHYFFLPVLPQLGNFLMGYPSFMMELVLGFSLSVIVLAISVLINRVVKVTSSFVGCILFGEKG